MLFLSPYKFNHSIFQSLLVVFYILTWSRLREVSSESWRTLRVGRQLPAVLYKPPANMVIDINLVVVSSTLSLLTLLSPTLLLVNLIFTDPPGIPTTVLESRSLLASCDSGVLSSAVRHAARAETGNDDTAKQKIVRNCCINHTHCNLHRSCLLVYGIAYVFTLQWFWEAADNFLAIKSGFMVPIGQCTLLQQELQ